MESPTPRRRRSASPRSTSASAAPGRGRRPSTRVRKAAELIGLRVGDTAEQQRDWIGLVHERGEEEIMTPQHAGTLELRPVPLELLGVKCRRVAVERDEIARFEPSQQATGSFCLALGDRVRDEERGDARGDRARRQARARPVIADRPEREVGASGPMFTAPRGPPRAAGDRCAPGTGRARAGANASSPRCAREG